MNKLLDKSKCNILIVDDIARNIQIVGNILRKENYQISYAQSGKAALERVENNQFDLILLDIMMPELNGFELCDILKKKPNTKDIPIIFLTAKSDVESTIEGFKKGAVDYITKPFNGTELLARIENHLALRQARQELALLNASKDKFFSIIAHDLKNPISAFENVTSLLNDKYDLLDENEKKEFIKMLKESANNVYDLLENLLDWSRTQTGRIQFEPSELELFRIIDTNINLLSVSAKKKDIEIQNNIEKSMKVYADNNMINTVVRNLVSNAIKFTNLGGIIKINQKLNDNFVKVEVIDNGVGISPENLDKLFKIDFNVSEKGTDNESGTGLGLILCKEFIEKHNGEIGALSEIGIGSNFFFTLPIYESIMSND